MALRIAIGGTKGKTTIASLIEDALLKVSPGTRVLSANSTEGVFLNRRRVQPADRETYLTAVDQDLSDIEHDFFLSEATSCMLALRYYERHDPDVAIFTGIEHTEHLDFHGTFEAYLRGKKRLYDGLSEDAVVIVNADDPHHRHVTRDCAAPVESCGFSKTAKHRLSIVAMDQRRMAFDLAVDANEAPVRLETPMLGEYNAWNTAAAFLTLRHLGFGTVEVKNAMGDFTGVPGRFQRVPLAEDRVVVIDYAHTEGSLRKVLSLIRRVYPGRRVVTVFGCGGDRSKQKRAPMGRGATELSDFVYLTSDNPRSEVPRQIIDDIVEGTDRGNYARTENRRKAMEQAILDNPGAVILVAGKGAERFTESCTRYRFSVCPECGRRFREALPRPVPRFERTSDIRILHNIVRRHGLARIDVEGRSLSRNELGRVTPTLKDGYVFRPNAAGRSHWVLVDAASGRRICRVQGKVRELLEYFRGDRTHREILTACGYEPTVENLNVLAQYTRALARRGVVEVSLGDRVRSG